MPKRTKAPSKKQVVALQLVSNGYNPTDAMLKAGYSKSTSRNPKKNLLSKPQVLSIIDQMNLVLKDKGINGMYLGEKLAEFAQSDNPKTFFSAYDRISKLVGIESQGKQSDPQIKRTVTFTEFVQDDSLIPNEIINRPNESSALDDMETLAI